MIFFGFKIQRKYKSQRWVNTGSMVSWSMQVAGQKRRLQAGSWNGMQIFRWLVVGCMNLKLGRELTRRSWGAKRRCFLHPIKGQNFLFSSFFLFAFSLLFYALPFSFLSKTQFLIEYQSKTSNRMSSAIVYCCRRSPFKVVEFYKNA